MRGSNAILVPGDSKSWESQMRWTLFDGYLFKYCSVKYHTFHEVSEKTSQQTYSPQKPPESFPDASKRHKTSTNLSNRAYFRQFSDWQERHFRHSQESPGLFTEILTVTKLAIWEVIGLQQSAISVLTMC